MALQGTLDTFSLPDVLRLLATTSKTGRLRIDGDRGQGSVWLNEGGIVDADAERAMDGTPTDEVVFELLRFGSGSFAFDGDDAPAGGGSAEKVESVLDRADALLGEWGELEAVVPSLAHQVVLANDLSVDEVTIDADRWRSVVAIAAGRTVGELATSLGLTELGVSRAVRDLVDLGVAEVEAPEVAPRPERPPAAEVPRRPAPAPAPAPAPPRPELDDLPTRTPMAPPTGENQRAGWLTGETPAVPQPRRAPEASPAPEVGRQTEPPPAREPRTAPTAGPDDTVADKLPSTEPPAKGGLASRLGRRGGGASRGASSRGAGARRGDATTGSTPAVGDRPPANGTRAGGPAPARTGRPDDAPAAPAGRTPAPEPARPVRPTGQTPAAPPRTPPTSHTPPPAPGTNGRPAPGDVRGRSAFEGGRSGLPPSPRDTGSIRPVMPSSLPPDLHWAADDTGSHDVNGGAPSSPFSGLSSLGPARPTPAPLNDGEIAPHVAAMSPEARAAVQSTVGNAGGSSGVRGMQGDDIAQRGRLISFLSTVR